MSAEPSAEPLEHGDAACWLDRVCPQCGALNDSRHAACWRCGETPEEQ